MNKIGFAVGFIAIMMGFLGCIWGLFRIIAYALGILAASEGTLLLLIAGVAILLYVTVWLTGYVDERWSDEES